MEVVGIHHGHDAGAALIRDGEIVAAANEERFSRKKFHRGFPERSLQFVLERSNDVDVLAVAGLYRKRKDLERVRDIAEELEVPVYLVEHHAAHAASAYYTSGFNRCLTITVDAAGDGLSATVWVCERGEMHRVSTESYYDSLGDFYANVTELLGFEPMKDEGKVMCLAAYAEPDLRSVEWIRREVIDVEEGNIVNRLGAISGEAVRRLKRSKLAKMGRERAAAVAQEALEELLLEYFGHYVNEYGENRIAYAGGVAANVVANMRLREELNIDLFVHPNMGDGGLAVGAALWAWAEEELARGRRPEPRRLEDVYFGPEYDREEVRKALEEHDMTDRAEYVGKDPDAIVRKLLEGKTVALFHSRMEYGPRALGARSILADPRDRGVVDKLNRDLGRDPFQPFAPTILSEDAPEYLRRPCESPFMTLAFRATDTFRRKAPAVVHVDGTTRPQTLRDELPFYREVIETFREETGLGAVLNTSFNPHGEPIVCSPRDALEAFEHGVADVLWIEGYMIERG
ncbi:carbamoyltransferase family protein [Methanopyrus kandleri]|uniref:Predicted carbamoyl transferase, NodU family n=2 Tax=Methanopyrus kandleri TaxID=2320 RepID=Q8TZ42_METKA|nr:carbamoyltransferase [Methanopyrus kandleri]AAM01314.1 Predicted carbamoyl transferase, NodU family [Methanopyrus kandleri AV19]HII70763.1 carbamoyltransferase [Methanopyrus kandleri]